MIQKTLSKTAANDLFWENAVLLNGREYVPDYRIHELFGNKAARFFANRGESNKFNGSTFASVKTLDNKKMTLFDETSFLEFVEYNNYQVVCKERELSQNALSWDLIDETKRAEIARIDAEGLTEELAKDLAEKESGEGEP